MLSDLEVRRRAHRLVASPDVAGHPTGGAVDVTLRIDGQDLDMGSGVADFSAVDRIGVFSRAVATDVQQRRLLLRQVMLSAGFAPFDGEWWHFSYGDREWASYYGHPLALYHHCEKP